MGMRYGQNDGVVARLWVKDFCVTNDEALVFVRILRGRCLELLIRQMLTRTEIERCGAALFYSRSSEGRIAVHVSAVSEVRF